jgi:hypothetical protein
VLNQNCVFALLKCVKLVCVLRIARSDSTDQDAVGLAAARVRFALQIVLLDSIDQDAAGLAVDHVNLAQTPQLMLTTLGMANSKIVVLS